MVLSAEDLKRIEWIRKNMNTQDKWLKGDYIEFYNRDIIFLLELVDKTSGGITFSQLEAEQT